MGLSFIFLLQVVRRHLVLEGLIDRINNLHRKVFDRFIVFVSVLVLIINLPLQLIVFVLQAIELDQHVIVHIGLIDVELFAFLKLGELLLHLLHQSHALVHLVLRISVDFVQSSLQIVRFLLRVAPSVPQNILPFTLLRRAPLAHLLRFAICHRLCLLCLQMGYLGLSLAVTFDIEDFISTYLLLDTITKVVVFLSEVRPPLWLRRQRSHMLVRLHPRVYELGSQRRGAGRS